LVRRLGAGCIPSIAMPEESGESPGADGAHGVSPALVGAVRLAS
jgi:hypothetical protein